MKALLPKVVAGGFGALAVVLVLDGEFDRAMSAMVFVWLIWWVWVNPTEPRRSVKSGEWEEPSFRSGFDDDGDGDGDGGE